MAVAAGEIQLTINGKAEIGTNRAIYWGTAQGGTAYPTGGATLGEEPTNSRHKMPERFDMIQIAAGLPNSLAPPNKVKLSAVAASEAAEAELPNGKTMATAIPAGTGFFAIGLR